LLENIFKYTTAIFESLFSICKIVLLSKYRVVLPKIQHNNLIILANGPSLNDAIRDEDITLSNSDILCVNLFPLSRFWNLLKPQYLVILSLEFLYGKSENSNEKLLELNSVLLSQTNWPVVVFVPYNLNLQDHPISQITTNSNITIQKINTTPVEGNIRIAHWLFQTNLGMPRPHNVLIPSLMLGINMGYRQIEIYGADHSWLKDISVDDKNRALINQKHFYDLNKTSSKPMHYKGARPRRLHEILHKFYLSFKGYHTIKAYSEIKGVRILNKTNGSFIDAFDRV
jgi:hypothetical protein